MKQHRAPVVVLASFALAGIVATIVFWPHSGFYNAQVLTSLFQFLATLALVWLTFLYVQSTQTIVNAQNRKPRIRGKLATIHPGDSETIIQFTIDISNPSTVPTSVSIAHARIGKMKAKGANFIFHGRPERTIPVPAGGRIDLILDVGFEEMPFDVTKPKPSARLVFEDVLFDLLDPVIIKL